jgi:MoaA/NifB/PqqE/SkfB family radical SAM enzyme
MNYLIKLIKSVISEKGKRLLRRIMAKSRHFPIKWNINKHGMSGHRIKLEACSMCQLNCIHCPTVEMLQINGLAKDSKSYRKEAARKSTIGWGSLAFSNFKQLIDNNPHIRRIELSNFGEIFLNPELPLMLRYAYEKGVILTAQNGVNLNNITDEMIECLVKYRFHNISVSIDGASQKTYSMYRRGGDFDRVLQNIRRINSLKEKCRSKYPKLSWSFIIFGHNEHEILKAKRIARELCMEFFTQLNCFPYYSPVKDREIVRQQSSHGVATIDELRQKRKKPVFSNCTDLWDCP